MGIDWMNRDELAEAIPPDYTQFIGEQIAGHLDVGYYAQSLAQGLRLEPVAGNERGY